MKSLFTLLKCGLELTEPTVADIDRLCLLLQKEWEEIRMMADKQGVSAIMLDGLNVLINKFGREKVASKVDPIWWQHFVLEWAGLMTHIEQRNIRQIEVMQDMAHMWSSNGFRVMVFKGQASGMMYPKPEHRSPGDIDCYLFEDYALGNETAKCYAAEVDESWYKHSVIRFHGETFENHQYFVHTREGRKSKQLQKELEDALKVEEWKRYPNSKVLLPPVQWNAMFLTYHACAHFLTEGLRLKQVLDWALFLQKYQEEVDWKKFYGFCQRYHLKRFVDAITAICVNNLGVKITSDDACKESPYVEKILNSTLYDDDYVFGSGEGGWRNRWHLVRNLFHYRWKYEEIYQESVWKQLWYDASGFLFHTE